MLQLRKQTLLPAVSPLAGHDHEYLAMQTGHGSQQLLSTKANVWKVACLSLVCLRPESAATKSLSAREPCPQVSHALTASNCCLCDSQGAAIRASCCPPGGANTGETPESQTHGTRVTRQPGSDG